MPSASIELSRISPAPSSAARTAQPIASMPVERRPPCVVTSKPESVRTSGASVPGPQRRASTESTTHWAPNRSAASASSSGRAIAAVFTPHLSAPARSSASKSADGADPAADGQRDEDLLGGPADHVVGGRPVPGGRGDVQERELVGSGLAVGLRQRDRVPGVAQVDEVDPLDHAAGVHVQARDHANGDGHAGQPRSGASLPKRGVIALPRPTKTAARSEDRVGPAHSRGSAATTTRSAPSGGGGQDDGGEE